MISPRLEPRIIVFHEGLRLQGRGTRKIHRFMYILKYSAWLTCLLLTSAAVSGQEAARFFGFKGPAEVLELMRAVQ